MKLIIALILSIAFAILLRGPIRKVPWVFYLLAVIIDVIYLTGAALSVARQVALVGFPYVMRGLFAISFFIIVMYIGVLDDQNQVRKMLMPIRGELSVIACILAFGHAINYLQSYLTVIFGYSSMVATHILIGMIIALIILILLIPLTITSFKSIKSRMNAVTWKRLQKASYVFFGLIYVHVLFILVPSALAGATEAIISIVLYSVIFVLYAVLRIRRALIDRKKANA
ncbi:MAG: hypothetical protein IKD70_10290 [Eggerthellaceae bacterium]|nr:hypothetical protein [Eggerthellaceae bacterium]